MSDDDDVLDEFGLAGESKPTAAIPDLPPLPPKPDGAFLTADQIAKFARRSNVLGNGIKWDVAEPKLEISVGVSFVEACTLDLTIFGKSVI